MRVAVMIRMSFGIIDDRRGSTVLLATPWEEIRVGNIPQRLKPVFHPALPQA
jgi:hypothetical protein